MGDGNNSCKIETRNTLCGAAGAVAGRCSVVYVNKGVNIFCDNENIVICFIKMNSGRRLGTKQFLFWIWMWFPRGHSNVVVGGWGCRRSTPFHLKCERLWGCYTVRRRTTLSETSSSSSSGGYEVDRPSNNSNKMLATIHWWGNVARSFPRNNQKKSLECCGRTQFRVLDDDTIKIKLRYSQTTNSDDNF